MAELSEKTRAKRVDDNGAKMVRIFASEQIESTRTLADRVTEALMRKIVGEELPAGSQLPSEQLMAQSFGVSRTVIRESISRLKSEGLVDTKQGRGAFVRTDRTDVPLRIGINSENPQTSLLHILELRLGSRRRNCIARCGASHTRSDVDH